jgi:hypothetical protein
MEGDDYMNKVEKLTQKYAKLNIDQEAVKKEAKRLLTEAVKKGHYSDQMEYADNKLARYINNNALPEKMGMH